MQHQLDRRQPDERPRGLHRLLPTHARPSATAWRHSNHWREDGNSDKVLDPLRKKALTAEKPLHPWASAGVDSQSGDATSGGEERGRDDAKNEDGRERHIVVDSMGSPLAVLVTAGDDDAKGAAELFGRLGDRSMGRVKAMYADSKYHNFTLYEWVGKNASWDLSIVRRREGAEGWVELPIRWAVERTFAGPGRGLGREVHGQVTPLAAGAEDVEDGVEDITGVGLAWPSSGLDGGDVGRNEVPLLIGDIAGVVVSSHIPLYTPQHLWDSL